MVADMDAAVGRIVSVLDRLELRENTVLLFTTDNGSPSRYLTHVEQLGKKVIRHRQPVVSDLAGEQVRGGKGQLTDAGTRVPLVVNWPGTTPAGRTCEDLIDFSDFLPTFAELAGVSLSTERVVDGRSFAPQLHGATGKPRPWVFCEHRGKQWVRTGRWKLYADGRLVDMESDPVERNPIAPAQASPEAASARELLRSAFESLGLSAAERSPNE
jgi:arylsulfatase A